jgi:hypothetical protein
MSPEERFKRELEYLRKDSYAAAQFLFSWAAFHHVAGSVEVLQAFRDSSLN